MHGARIVAEVVNDEGMFGEWKDEMEMMSGRIKGVRQLLYDELVALNADKDWSFVLKQIGMFSFTGAPFQLLAACQTFDFFLARIAAEGGTRAHPLTVTAYRVGVVVQA